MGFWNSLFGQGPDYRWLKMIPENLRPSEEKVEALERLRKEWGIPHQDLAGRVIDSRVTTEKIQAQMAQRFRSEFPEASDRKIWRMILASRATPPYPNGWGWAEHQVDEAMQEVDSFESLIKLIHRMDDEMDPRPPDPIGLGSQVDEILSG